MRKIRAAFLIALVFLPRTAGAQGNPLGPEFRVNTYTTSHQAFPSVGAGSGGNFVVVWASAGQDGSGSGIFGQRYSSSGPALGPEFRVNTYTTSDQSSPSVAADAAGNFVVVWSSLDQDGSGSGIFGQRYASTGAPLGPEFRVNTFTSNNQSGPSVAADSLGNFVVVWEGFLAGVWGQRFASSGVPLGVEFQVTSGTAVLEDRPSVASGSSGNFVVTWLRGGISDLIMARVYSNSGAPLTADFVVAAPHYLEWANNSPAVASDAAGNFVVVWTGGYFLGPFDIFGRRFNSAGVPFGLEFQVNSFVMNSQYEPAVAADPSGNFVVVWNSFGQDGLDLGVFGRRFLSSGLPLSSDFRVNTYTTSAQREPSVAADSSGNFVVVWESYGQDGPSGWGVFGQRYAQIVPVELTSFTIE